MKHLLNLAALSVVVSLVFGCSSTPEKRPPIRDVPTNARDDRNDQPRKRMMVLPFIDLAQDRAKTAAESARRGFLRALGTSKSFVLVDPKDFPRDMNGFRVNDQYDLDAIGKIANGMGVALVVEGRILEIKAKRLGDQVGLVRRIRAQMEAKVQIRVMGAKQGRELMNEIREATIEDTTTRVGSYAYSDKFLEEDPELIEQVVSKAFRSIVPAILAVTKKISWEGRIAQVSGDRIYINAGRRSGIQVGDVLRVNDDGQEVFDPETGQYIGRAPGKMKGTVEVISYFGEDGAVGVIHSGSGFRETDQVEFY